MKPERVVVFGTESQVSREEYEFVIAHGIQVISASTVAREGVAGTLGPALERALDGADGLYATLDIDAGARSLVPGTGNQNGVLGLTPADMLDVAAHLADLPLKGIDISELSPPLDPSGLTAGMCASMLMQVLAPRLYSEVAFPSVAGPGSAA